MGRRSARRLRRVVAWRAMLAAWLFGLLLLAAVISVSVHLGEIQEFGRLLRQLRPAWLLVAVSLQALTYLCAAGVWQLALSREGRRVPLRTLVAPALAMLFANQAFPSAGVSGSLVVVRAVRRRRVPSRLVMGALIVGLVTSYAAYLAGVVIGLVVLLAYHAVNLTLLLVSGAFALAGVAVPAAVIWYRESLAPRLPRAIARLPGIGTFLKALASAPEAVLHDGGLLGRAVVLQSAEILLDAATLFVMLLAIGAAAAPAAVFGGFVIAAAISSVAPMPLGLGTFEATQVAMLRIVGVPIEAALTATLLLRGFTLWLPMLPGLWCARRELGSHRRYS